MFDPSGGYLVHGSGHLVFPGTSQQIIFSQSLLVVVQSTVTSCQEKTILTTTVVGSGSKSAPLVGLTCSLLLLAAFQVTAGVLLCSAGSSSLTEHYTLGLSS